MTTRPHRHNLKGKRLTVACDILSMAEHGGAAQIMAVGMCGNDYTHESRAASRTSMVDARGQFLAAVHHS